MKFDPDSQIRMATADDADALLELINLVQPHVPWNRKFLEWQYFEVPSGPARVYVVEIDSRIVAQYANVPFPLVTEAGKVAMSWTIQDVMTHPDFRGQGMLHALGDRAYKEMSDAGDYGFIFPNQKSAGSFQRSNGWHQLCSVPFRTASLASVSRSSSATLIPVDSARQLQVPKLPVRFGRLRSADYLDWRYRKPGQQYQLYNVGESDGCIVLKRYEHEDGPVMHLCDIVLTDSDRVRSVLNAAMALSASEGAEQFTAWMTQGRLGARFCECYFPGAEVLVTGHFHCLGVRRSRGRTVINTGSFVVPGAAGWVEWDGESLSTSVIRISHSSRGMMTRG